MLVGFIISNHVSLGAFEMFYDCRLLDVFFYLFYNIISLFLRICKIFGLLWGTVVFDLFYACIMAFLDTFRMLYISVEY